jgi:hypothetical protein
LSGGVFVRFRLRRFMMVMIIADDEKTGTININNQNGFFSSLLTIFLAIKQFVLNVI